MADNEPFGFNPDDLNRMFPGAGEQLKGLMGQLGRMFDGGDGRPGGAGFRPRPAAQPETAGDAGDGVWAIYTVSTDGGAQVEQVFATELDALRANKSNTDMTRTVRFLPYGISVSVLDAAQDAGPDSAEATED
ncbi:MAG: hypothetical protein ABJA16_13160 [Nakamurella sp.]